MCVNDVNAHQSAAAGEKARWRATDRDAPRGRALPERGLRGLQHAMLHNVHRPRIFGELSTGFEGTRTQQVSSMGRSEFVPKEGI